MEEVPDIPVIPAAGQQASDELICAAMNALARREHLREHASPDGKRQRGADVKQVFKIVATAALPNAVNQNALLHQLLEGQQQLQQQLQQVLQGQQALNARFDNARIRRLNRDIIVSGGPEALLQPLHREQTAAGGDYRPGDLPPAGWFPANTAALNLLTGPMINRLEQFYGRQFAGPSVPFRRKSFQNFLCDENTLV